VNGLAANAGAIGRLFADLATTEVGDLAATNPANHARMGVSADSASVFEIGVGADTRSILVGKQGPRIGTAYGRLPDRDEVYLIEGDLRAHVRRTRDDWRKTEILAIDSSRVARIEVERDGEAYTVVRGDSLWTFEGGAPVDALQMRNVLIELASMIASGFVAEDDSLFALPQGGANTAYASDGTVLAEVTIGSGEGERWARTAGDNVVYRLSSFRVGRIAPPRATMDPGSG
jgi:hypothetical protein